MNLYNFLTFLHFPCLGISYANVELTTWLSGEGNVSKRLVHYEDGNQPVSVTDCCHRNAVAISLPIQ